ncbi:MAG TPA: NAD-dependent epimerase/dehydratase family protein [Vicinamibacterales bacterium]|nr:NAD-dependent epimerase/dehydratase family protein [Vicinamibacterales bacterium]
MKKALVTGAAGFIGTALVQRLVSDKWHVVAIDCRPTTYGGVTNVVADVSVSGAVREWLDSDTTVFHLAAIASVPQSVEDPRADFTNTMRPVFEVLESARAAGARVVFPSTASVFDSSNPLPLDERAMIRPTSPYGAAKVAGEAYCFAYHRAYGVDTRIARFFSVFGPGLRRLAIHDLIRKVQRATDELEILGDGTQVRDYLYIDDAVDALLTVARHGAPGEDYNIGSGVPVTALDLARRITTAMSRPELRLRPTGTSFSGDTPRWYADISKIRTLGFEPRVSFDEGLRRTVAWLTSRRG